MNNSILKCIKCDWKGKFIDYQSHYDKIHKSFNCKFCNYTFNDEDSLTDHLDGNAGSCRNGYFICTYEPIGCNVKMMNKLKLEEHLKSECAYHLKCLHSYAQEQFSKMSSSNLLNSSKNEEHINSENSKRKEEKHNIGKSEPMQMDSDTRVYIEKMYLDSIVQISVKNDKLSMELEQSILNEEKHKQEINELKSSLLLAHTTIVDLQERLFEQENTSHNGVFLWKITDVEGKIKDAKSTRQASFYSTHFYTHLHGYKMSL